MTSKNQLEFENSLIKIFNAFYTVLQIWIS
jgi:hypothetical protein